MRSHSFAALILLAISVPLHSKAQENSDKLTVTPTGRVLIDGALYCSPEKELFPSGFAIPEVRLGAKMNYGKWSSSIDVGYAYGKIGLRNMWIEYGFNPNNNIRFGNFIHQFGLQSTSQSLKTTFEQPIASAPFTPGLQFGGMFLHHSPRFFAAGSFFAESESMKRAMEYPGFTRQGLGLLSRFVWHIPSCCSSSFHLGISGGLAIPSRKAVNDSEPTEEFTLNANFPTKVTQKRAVGITVPDSRNLVKFTPEAVWVSPRYAFEGQYFFQNINCTREHLSYKSNFNYISQSAYATFRTMLFGKGYSYSTASSQVQASSNNSLEFVANGSWVKLTHNASHFQGGDAWSLTATLNWYINPYITARLNYSYTDTYHSPQSGESLGAFQARLMVLF